MKVLGTLVTGRQVTNRKVNDKGRTTEGWRGSTPIHNLVHGVPALGDGVGLPES